MLQCISVLELGKVGFHEGLVLPCLLGSVIDGLEMLLICSFSVKKIVLDFILDNPEC